MSANNSSDQANFSDPLHDAAWEFHQLIRFKPTWDHVCTRISNYLSARAANPKRRAIKDLLRYDEELTLDEKFALLAALHDSVCTGEAKIGPEWLPSSVINAADSESASFDALTTEDAMKVLRWEALLDTVKGWLHRSVDPRLAYEIDGEFNDYTQHAQSWLEDVRVELEIQVRSTAANEIPVGEESDDGQCVFQLSGEIWHIRFHDESGDFQDNQGFRHLAVLLASPSYRRSGLELSRAEKKATTRRGGKPDKDESWREDVTSFEHSVQPVADDEAIKQYREKAEELAEEIRKTDKDDPLLPLLRRDFQTLLEQIEKSKRLNGRKRNLSSTSPANKAFNAAKRSIKRSWKRLKDNGLPNLVKHLTKCIRFESPDIIYAPGYDPLHPHPTWKI